jgi:O-acetylhomoserine (thiol)-lyase
MKRDTIAIHGGYETDPTTKSVAVPIYQTAAYAFDSAEHGAALFNLEVEGNIYTRLGNPTAAVLERRVAALEGGVGALAVASGAAAISYAIKGLAEIGHNIVSLPHLYGATFTLFEHLLPREGIQVRFTKTNDPGDIAAVAAVAHAHGLPLIVDNTVASPMLLRPIEHGADIVLHSMTKFIGGHGTTLGGIIVDSGAFPWLEHRDRFAMMSQPEPAYHDVVYTDQFGAAAYIGRCRTLCLRNTGAILPALSAFLLLQGIETLGVRMDRHVQNGLCVAMHLRDHPQVEWVNYVGFPDNPYHELAKRYLGGRFPSLLTFGVKGGFEVGRGFFDALKMFKRLVNLGDAKSLATHPASTTHRQLSPDELARVGVSPEMIRFSVGIEDIDDILADIDQAFAVTAPQHAVQDVAA